MKLRAQTASGLDGPEGGTKSFSAHVCSRTCVGLVRTHTHTLIEMRADWKAVATRQPGFPILNSSGKNPKEPGVFKRKGGPKREREGKRERGGVPGGRKGAKVPTDSNES